MPNNLMDKAESMLKEADRPLFITPIGSLLPLLPLVFWEKIAFNSNTYALQKFWDSAEDYGAATHARSDLYMSMEK